MGRVEVATSRDAVARVYEEQGARLWRALYAFTGDREIASDALAEAIAQALAHRTGPDEPDRWIWAVAFRIAAGELKRIGRQASLQEEPYTMQEPAVDLLRALKTLSPKQRAVVILSVYGGYPTKEIARLVGSSAATVRVHMSQGRRRLRAALGDEDG
jgi:RNA polymerase sigma factor (sigma-70 family)